MSDSEPDTELLELLRQYYPKDNAAPEVPALEVPAPEVYDTEVHDTKVRETDVLKGAKYVFDNSIDVALVAEPTHEVAAMIYEEMQNRDYSTKTWMSHELHPQTKDESTVAFIFTMDLLNFCFWSEKEEDERFAIEYKGKRWTGYTSLIAALQRALDEEIPITSSDFWQNEDECTEEVMKYIFRSATEEEIPLLHERLACLREAGQILYEKYSCSFTNCIKAANHSAAALVNLLANNFPCFNDTVQFEERESVPILKRAQICVADLWAAFDGQDFGSFEDIDKITMFADYRIPQILNNLGCLWYSPPLKNTIRQKKIIESGHSWEIQLRGCSIWCVELIRKEILREHPDSKVNAILIDFFLYDMVKENSLSGLQEIPHHRTRSIWY